MVVVLKKKTLPALAITVLKIWSTIIMSLLSFIGGMIAVFNFNAAVISMVLFLVLYGYMILFYCEKRCKEERYIISKDKIYREKGVFFKKETEMLTDNIQCIKIVEDPIQKTFGLYTVVFYSAGCKEKIALIDYEEVTNIKRCLWGKKVNEI